MKKMKGLICFLTALVAILCFPGVIIGEQFALMERQITQPSPNMLWSMRAFSGIWYGMDNEVTPVTLMVEKIQPPFAFVLLSWGVEVEGCYEVDIRSWQMELDLPDGRIVFFFLAQDPERPGSIFLNGAIVAGIDITNWAALEDVGWGPPQRCYEDDPF